MLIGRTLLSRYKIINKIGSGGFGDTYLAVDIALPNNPQCVVKQLKPKDPNPDIFPIAKGLFQREAEFLYRLGEHDQIPRLYAHFEEEGEFFLVEEFVDGDNLSKEIVSGQPLSEKQTVHLLQEILEVLAVVHQQNVIHRDIKPDNIMRRKRDGKLILIDFGAVKEISVLTVNEKGQTSITIGIGSPGYMPCEQALGRPRLASDVYAVGAIAIQALTGVNANQLPKDPHTEEIIWRKVAPTVSDRFADVLDTMVRYHFNQRFKNASDALKGVMSTVPSSKVSPRQQGTKNRFGLLENFRRVRVTVHSATFIGSYHHYYFINVTNLSTNREIEITHVWFDTKPETHVFNPERPLPKRLKPDESWETWYSAASLPARENDPYVMARVRLSNGKVLKSRKNKNVPDMGDVPG